MKQCSYISLYISHLSCLTEKRDLDNKNNKIYGYYANDIRLYLDDNIGKLSYVFQNTLNSKQKKIVNYFFVFWLKRRYVSCFTHSSISVVLFWQRSVFPILKKPIEKCPKQVFGTYYLRNRTH